MKKIFFVITILFFQISFGQDVQVDQEYTADDVYNSAAVDVKPEFPGGVSELYKYVGRNFSMPTYKEFKGGRMIVRFVIEIDGSITHIEVKKDAGFGSKEEAIRVFKASPKWQPAEKNGQKVRCTYLLPILLQTK